MSAMVRPTRLGMGTLALFACHSNAPAPASSRTPSAPTASVPAVVVDNATFDVYRERGSSGDWVVGVERHRSSVRLVFTGSDVSHTYPLVVSGELLPSGAFHATDGLKPPLVVEGSLTGDNLDAAFEGTSTTIALEREAKPSQPRAFQGPFFLTFDDDRTRTLLQWKTVAGVVTASYTRHVGAARVLEGKTDDAGRFALTEKDTSGAVIARWQGAVIASSAAIARRTDAFGKSVAVLLDGLAQPYPAAVPLGDGQLVPRDSFQRPVSGCVVDTIFPKLMGPTARAADAALRKEFAVDASTPTCSSPPGIVQWSATTYTVTAARADWVGLERRTYVYMGGAHGMAYDDCLVVTADGRVAHLAKELSAASRKSLVPRVTQALLKKEAAEGTNPNPMSLRDVGFTSDAPAITEKHSMCAIDDHGTLSMEVVFENDTDGYFRFWEPRARLSASAVRSLFPSGSVGAMVFASP